MTTTENTMTLGGAIGKFLAEVIGAERHERADARQNQRNRYREQPFGTRVGTIDLQGPKRRQGSYFPSFVEEAYVNGVSTRKVETLVQRLGVALSLPLARRHALEDAGEPLGGELGGAGLLRAQLRRMTSRHRCVVRAGRIP